MTGNAAPAESADRRVRKTKKALRDALVELILEKGYGAVTVQDVVERADVGRTTFYAHFTDKEDLLASGFEELHGAAATPRPGNEMAALGALARDMLTHAEVEKRLYRAIMGRRGANPIAQMLEQQLASFVEGILHAAKPAAPPIRVSMAARMATVSFLGVVAWWLDTDQPLTADQVADAFEVFAIPGLEAMLA